MSQRKIDPKKSLGRIHPAMKVVRGKEVMDIQENNTDAEIEKFALSFGADPSQFVRVMKTITGVTKKTKEQLLKDLQSIDLATLKKMYGQHLQDPSFAQREFEKYKK